MKRNALRQVSLLLVTAGVACGGGVPERPPENARPPASSAAASPSLPPTAAAEAHAATPLPAAAAPQLAVTSTPPASNRAAAAPGVAPAAATPAPPTSATATAPPVTTPAPAPRATAQAAPAAAALPSRPEPKGPIALPAKLGAVRFDHGRHAGELKAACVACHHPSRAEKPLAAAHQACRECHGSPATSPMKTGRQAAFHDPKAGAGTCISCHKEVAAKGRAAPLKCAECHKRGA